jgi:hypothetical protein
MGSPGRNGTNVKDIKVFGVIILRTSNSFEQRRARLTHFSTTTDAAGVRRFRTNCTDVLKCANEVMFVLLRIVLCREMCLRCSCRVDS